MIASFDVLACIHELDRVTRFELRQFQQDKMPLCPLHSSLFNPKLFDFESLF